MLSDIAYEKLIGIVGLSLSIPDIPKTWEDDNA